MNLGQQAARQPTRNPKAKKPGCFKQASSCRTDRKQAGSKKEKLMQWQTRERLSAHRLTAGTNRPLARHDCSVSVFDSSPIVYERVETATESRRGVFHQVTPVVTFLPENSPNLLNSFTQILWN